jgi:hypothetical protein
MTERRWEIDGDDWDRVRRTLRSRLERTAGEQGLITYSELVAGVPEIDGPHSRALPSLLGEISTECHVQGLPMLSALVIYKDRTQAGRGFFGLARQLGFAIGSSAAAEDAFWAATVRAVHQTWRSAEAA